MAFDFPKIYPILDASIIPTTGRAEYLHQLGSSLADAGVTLLEYRNKIGSDAEIISDTEILRVAMPEKKIKLILDDRLDLVERMNFDGVHVDLGDAPPAEARKLLGATLIIGTFGGSEDLVPGILDQPADYFSIGPVFPTTTKHTIKSAIGPEGVLRLRAHAGAKPVLVAVGGITLETARVVLAAGATTIAVAAGIFRAEDPAAEFRRWRTALE
jgi:thiamine-phosphate pyrophosphorylase